MKNQFRILTIIALLVFSFKGVFAQQQLNDYKYVIVQEVFSCQKSANDFRLNELTKFLLQKQDFTVFLASEEIPDDVAKNNCLALFVDVTEEKSTFKTKLKLVFKDCRSNVVYTTTEGVSREKVFKTAYNLALRAAVKTFASFKHAYNANNQEFEVVVEKTEMPEPKPVIQPKPKIKEAVVVKTPKTSVRNEQKTEEKEINSNKTSNSLKAELIPGSVFSYKLKNNKTETVYTILFSGKEDIYIVKGQDALIYKMNNVWVIADYKDKDLQIKTLDIQF